MFVLFVLYVSGMTVADPTVPLAQKECASGTFRYQLAHVGLRWVRFQCDPDSVFYFVL
jgi:hypothetical protein